MSWLGLLSNLLVISGSGRVGLEIWQIGSGRVTENGPVGISDISDVFSFSYYY